MKKTNKNILAKCHPDLIQAEWCWDYKNVLGLDPHQITVSSTKPVFWTCTGCNSIYLMAPKKRLEAAAAKFRQVVHAEPEHPAIFKLKGILTLKLDEHGIAAGCQLKGFQFGYRHIGHIESRPET